VTDREQELVELVDSIGTPVGTSTVSRAHTQPGELHRAFSVVVFDGAGRTLLQQRSAAKSRFPLRWANACCGHPGPGEAVSAAASRRVRQELGIPLFDLEECGVYLYRADDPLTGRVELEYDHVLVARVPAPLAVAPDPNEVAAVEWVDARTLADELLEPAPDSYAPWLGGVISLAIGLSPPV
jgi:isopentenyl-diphosphate delta-isomerase